ncbi:hypothetical protein E2C01_028398 [Portunus trituberculatus]|uniref:Uncharacterized protein n=1 Tax=Portunus trituberculatus TaxID=210409 RepID=A0A5B7EKI5_PORTR|nr:hypothetical protein [Portunus trituberculatus]
MGTRASQVVAHVDAISSFGTKIISKTANDRKVNEEKLQVSKHFGPMPREQSDLVKIMVHFPEGDSNELEMNSLLINNLKI